MKLTFVQTKDKTPTLYNDELDEHYHSIHGARQESEHVYIKSGVEVKKEATPLRIFEMGFGTGLNVMLTILYAQKHQLTVDFTTIETDPLPKDIYSELAFSKDPKEAQILQSIHAAAWDEGIPVNEMFTLTKKQVSLHEYEVEQGFDVIFYDAFGPDKQPDLWTLDIFEKVFSMILPRGVLVTYSAKGQVRRNMISAGFSVERIPGPPGKREMLRANKPVV